MPRTNDRQSATCRRRRAETWGNHAGCVIARTWYRAHPPGTSCTAWRARWYRIATAVPTAHPPDLVHIVSHGPHCLDGVTSAVAVARFHAGREVVTRFANNPEINEAIQARARAAARRHDARALDHRHQLEPARDRRAPPDARRRRHAHPLDRPPPHRDRAPEARARSTCRSRPWSSRTPTRPRGSCSST